MQRKWRQNANRIQTQCKYNADGIQAQKRRNVDAIQIQCEQNEDTQWRYNGETVSMRNRADVGAVCTGSERGM